MTVAEPLLLKNIHPTRIVKGFFKALEDAVGIMSEKLAVKIDMNDNAKVMEIVKTCIGTKFTVRYSDLMCKLAVDAVRTVADPQSGDVDIKKFARVEKVPIIFVY